MIWVAIGVLAAISLGLKAVGPVVVGDRELDPRTADLVALLPVPMLAALVVVGALADGQSLQVDARLPAVAVAAVCIARRTPFLVVICAAAATAAVVRTV
jgi:branched-subunit amino acid transport protein